MESKSPYEASSSTSRNSSHDNGGNRGETVVVDCGRRRSSCGYCKSRVSSSISHGLWAQSLTVDDYQDLLDRGWRRSGCFLYKPEMERTCCPSYTIRLKAADFVPSKEQSRVSRRIERYLDGTMVVKKQVQLSSDPSTSKVSCNYSFHEVSQTTGSSVLRKEDKKTEQLLHFLSNEIDKVVKRCAENGELPYNLLLPKASVKEVSQGKKKKLVKGQEEDLLYTTNIAFQIAAALRHAESSKRDEEEIKLCRQSEEGKGKSRGLSAIVIGEMLASLLSQAGESACLLVRGCNGHINFYSAIKQASSDEGDGITNSSPAKNGNKRTCLTEGVGCSQGKRQKLEIRLEKSSFDREEYELYKRYQIKVHNDSPDKVSESSYKRFLVDTPLVFVSPTGDSSVPPCGFGSFHQRYTIDGQLVAVGVVDILPKCLSSKYLFWDPDLAFLSIGKYSALQEINWVRENEMQCPSLQCYYLGYYIHSCSKMRYKAAYYPSELLCPLRYKWVPFKVAKPLLDRKKYVILSDYVKEEEEENGEALGEFDSENGIEVECDEREESDLNDVMRGDEEEEEEEEMEEDGEYGKDNSGDDEERDRNEAAEDDGEIGGIAIGLRGARFRYKDLRMAFGSGERNYLETQLKRYKRVVGGELSERMVYSIG